jgi:cell division protein FtsW (lipid II flippase)
LDGQYGTVSYAPFYRHLYFEFRPSLCGSGVARNNGYDEGTAVGYERYLIVTFKLFANEKAGIVVVVGVVGIVVVPSRGPAWHLILLLYLLLLFIVPPYIIDRIFLTEFVHAAPLEVLQRNLNGRWCPRSNAPRFEFARWLERDTERLDFNRQIVQDPIEEIV